MMLPDEIAAEHITMIKEKTGEVVSWSEGHKSMHDLISVVAILYLPEFTQDHSGVRGPSVPPLDLGK